MTKFWVMKTFKDWSNDFVDKREIGLDEEGVDLNYLDYELSDKPIGNDLILRRFDQFCKWAKVGDYVIVGIGQMTKFNMKIICKITGGYKFDEHNKPYRHKRDIEIIKCFDEPVEIKKWGQMQRFELIDIDDFMDTLRHI